MNKELKAVLEKRVSKKNNEYYVIVVYITPTCPKYVFLEPAELELIKNSSK